MWGYVQNTLYGHFKKYREALVCSTALHFFTLTWRDFALSFILLMFVSSLDAFHTMFINNLLVVTQESRLYSIQHFKVADYPKNKGLTFQKGPQIHDYLG